VLRPIVVLCAAALLLAVACGDDGGDSSDGTPNATSTPEVVATPTIEESRTPTSSGLLDDVIDLAVRLDAMTRDQAVCVFQDHPSIFNAFLQLSGLNQPSSIIEATLRQQFEDLKREYAVQLGRCFTIPSG
jgi:hypothetical protein